MEESGYIHDCLACNFYLAMYTTKIYMVMCRMVGHQNSGRRYTLLLSFWYNLLPQGHSKFNWIKFGIIL